MVWKEAPDALGEALDHKASWVTSSDAFAAVGPCHSHCSIVTASELCCLGPLSVSAWMLSQLAIGQATNSPEGLTASHKVLAMVLRRLSVWVPEGSLSFFCVHRVETELTKVFSHVLFRVLAPLSGLAT